jgi:hypothetical protein
MFCRIWEKIVDNKSKRILLFGSLLSLTPIILFIKH